MSTLRYRIEYAALRGLMAVYGALPPWVASNAGGAVFRAIGPMMGISRVGRANIARAFPHWTRAQVEDCLKGMWDNLGRVIAEYPHLEALARDHTVFTDPRAFEALHNGPVLFVSGHLGNWEVLPPAILLQQGLAMHSAYRAPNNPYVDTYLIGLRAFGGRLRSFGKHRRGLTDILRALQNHEAVGMLIDQKMNTGIAVPFFNVEAMTSTAFVELARKVQCPLVPGRIVRKQGCNFEVSLEPEIEVGDRPTEDIIADMHAILEGWIRETPAQWLWIHRRWGR